MIPKVCHFYWGGGKLSFLQYLSIVSFQKYNPTWQVNLFMPKKVELTAPTWITTEQKDAYTGKDYLAQAKKLCKVIEVDFTEHIAKPLHEVQKSDLIRWHILHEYGGIWSDIDILFTQSVDRLLELGFDTAICFHDDPYIGFFVSRSQQELFEALYTIAKDNVRRNMDDGYQALGAGMIRYRYESYAGMQAAFPQINIANLSMDIVYPYRPDADINEMFFGSVDKRTPDTFGLHWYNGSPVAKRYQNNFDKYSQNNSIISKLVKEYT